MLRWRSAMLAASLFIVNLCLAADPPKPSAAPTGFTPQDTIPDAIAQPLQARQYDEALQAIDQAAAAKKHPADFLAWLRARTLHHAGRYEQAAQAFDQLAVDFPKSRWAAQAPFARAVSLARKGDFRSAELIYRQQAERLLSAERKQELADIYLEFADLFFKPADEQTKPDYAKALEFYNRALEVAPPGTRRAEVELRVAECYQLMCDYGNAITRYQEFVTRYAGKTDAKMQSLEIEARFRQGESELAAAQHEPARRTWQDLLAAFPDAKNDRLPQAAYLLAKTYNFPQPETDDQLSRGVTALESFIKKWPTHKLAARAALDLATANVHRGRFEAAVKTLDQLLKDQRYAAADEIPEAQNLLGRSYLLMKKFPEALATWREYLAKYPAHSSWSAVQNQIVNTEYLLGSDALADKKYDDARRLWNEFLVKYPLDPRQPGILYLFGQMQFQQQRWNEAVADWRRVVSKFPDSDEASRAQYMIGVVTEEKLARLPEALKEYRKVTWGSFAPAAQARIARLTTKTLVVATERVFRSNEKPRVKLISRNLESVQLRVYAVDMETYFRKMHLATGLEALDIALIDPDQTFEFKVPNYVEHQQSEHDVEIPIPTKAPKDAGVLAVTVSSKTHETTTMVVRSDLDMICKASRDELFVFAQNMRTGKPWAKARLLVSNGSQVFTEATTGDDGVWQKACAELRDAGDVRVFAVVDGHMATNIVSLEGLTPAAGLSDRGYIYTDRPAYRAGQMVHVRGIVRRVENDNYVVDRGRKYTVEVFDPRNRLVSLEEARLSDYGTLHTHFSLPVASPPGEYRVLVRDLKAPEGQKQEFSGTFAVHDYQLQPVRLVIDSAKRVYYRGDEIEGTIQASFYHGGPLVDREVRYQLAGGRVTTARTDAEGKIKFKFPTREYRESMVLGLSASLPERNLTATTNFLLATQGYTINVATQVRNVYVAGETFEATVHTVDAEGKPIGKKLSLNVYEQTLVDGKRGERSVQKHDLTTDATGNAKLTLKLEQGGVYILRAAGTDQFDNTITGQHLVQISDDSDRVRLRILADRYTYKVGETAQVRVHWREAPALALVTYQGARVLGYQLVNLKTGDNTITIPMAARLAPNFELAINLMTDTRPDPQKKDQPVVRFHAAAAPITVERDLKVKLLAGLPAGVAGTLRPEGEVEVRITTTDSLGKPVGAELSLGMIEQALVDRFGNALDRVDAFFTGSPRRPMLRLASTIVFSYRPQTRPINPQLLAEADRLDQAADERAKLAVMQFAQASSRAPHGYADSAPINRPMGGQLVLDNLTSDVSELGRFSDADKDFDRPDFENLLNGNYFGAWADVGGAGAVAEFESNLSLIITDAAALHDHRFGYLAGGTGGMGGGIGPGVALESRAAGHAPRPTASPADSLARDSYALPRSESAAQSANLRWNINKPAYAERKMVDQLARHPELLGVQERLGEDEGGKLNKAQDSKSEFAKLALGDRERVLLRDGVQENVDRKALPAVKQKQLDGDLAAGRAQLVPQASAQETAYWNPAVVTDAKGQATLRFMLPDRSTAWKLFAKGVTVETLAGESDADLVVKKNLFSELKLPLAFVDGDQAQLVATVHNTAAAKGPIEVVLRTTIGTKSVEEKKTIPAGAAAMGELTFPASIALPAAADQPADGRAAEVVFELTVATEGERDTLRRAVPIRPFGLPVYSTAGGSAAGDTTVWIEPTPDLPFESPRLEIVVGPSVERSLLDVIIGPPMLFPCGAWASGLDVTASDLMAAVGLQKLVDKSRDVGGPAAAALDARIRSSLGTLVAAQNDDGGWSWTGRGGSSDRLATARVVWSLSMAKSRGYTIPDDTLNKALQLLKKGLVATSDTDYESKAILLSSLAAAGQGDFTLANRLYRNRPALSSAALVHLALAFIAMDRKATAAELLDVLATHNLDDVQSRRERTTGNLPWSQSGVELRALYAWAAQQVAPGGAKAKELAEWLLAHRTGHRWNPEKATGPATLALAGWFADARFANEHYQLTIFVNDYQAKVLDVTETTGTQTIEIPAKLLKAGKQRINFQLTGRGRFTFQAIYSGFAPADKLKNTTKSWTVKRRYEPATREFDGQTVPRGFGNLEGSYTSFVNPLTQLPVARQAHVTLDVWRENLANNTPDEQLDYLVVTEPLPSGATVIESSVRGQFERFEQSAGELTFYIGPKRYPGSIHYELHGYLPGKYHAAPTVVRSAYAVDQMAVAKTKELDVLPAGATSADPYRLTPQELFELGKRHFARKEYADASRHLKELLDQWHVQLPVYRETVAMLLDAHLELGPPAEVVRYFELVKEKSPDVEIPFDKILRVAAAYHEIGEYERSFLVFRATVESSFLRDSAVAGTLDKQGEFSRSVEVMERLFREYPPEPYLAAAQYALAQRVYAYAPQAGSDARLRDQKIGRVDLVRRALDMLDGFLSNYPEDPAADQASFSLANALLELKAYRAAIARCMRFAELYPGSDFLDSYWYIVGFSHFALGEHEQALALCRKVAETERVDKQTGLPAESRNKWQAIYILGQVYHSLGKAADAIREYTRVEDRFDDARQAIAYFMRQEISLPEVTTLKPGEAVQVDLKFRNVPRCDVKVYRIDLMKFSLLNRNLAGITQINLAGIRPQHEAVVELGDGRDYRDRTHQLPVPVKDEGAYLVVCRGEQLHASGLLLVSPLVVEVQEEATAGLVRATVKDTTRDAYLPQVHVKTIGTRNSDFTSGETDLRGVFVANQIQGVSTVIAQADGNRYAFFRGKTELGPPPVPTSSPPVDAAPAIKQQEQVSAPAQAGNEQQLLEGLQQGNRMLQETQIENLKRTYDNDYRRGVQAKEAF